MGKGKGAGADSTVSGPDPFPGKRATSSAHLSQNFATGIEVPSTIRTETL